MSILIAIVSTANHFILDAVAGAAICAIGWRANDVLLYLLPIEDWFLWCLRMHKPSVEPIEIPEFNVPDYEDEKRGSGEIYPKYRARGICVCIAIIPGRKALDWDDS